MVLYLRANLSCYDRLSLTMFILDYIRCLREILLGEVLILFTEWLSIFRLAYESTLASSIKYRFEVIELQNTNFRERCNIFAYLHMFYNNGKVHLKMSFSVDNNIGFYIFMDLPLASKTGDGNRIISRVPFWLLLLFRIVMYAKVL